MSRLTPIPFRKLNRILLRLGFKQVRQSGSHVVYQHGDGRAAVVPRHGREDIQIGLLHAILEEAHIDRQDFGRLR